VRYGVAAAAAGVGLLLQSLLIPLFGVGPNASPFMVFFGAVMFAAWFGGLGPGLLATALSALLSWYFFLFPQWSLALLTFGQSLRLIVFVLEGVAISLLVGAMHSARRKAEANSLEIRRSEHKVQVRARQQEVVAELGRHAISTTDLGALMEEAVDLVSQTLGVEYCKITELLPDGKELLLKVGVGWSEGLVGSATEGAGRDSQAGYALLSDEPVILEDLRTETRFSASTLLHEHGVVSGMSTIIRGRERPFGVLEAHTKESRKFNNDDANFLRAVADVVAAAVERHRAEEIRSFLAEAGGAPSSSLKHRAALVTNARPKGPFLADWGAGGVLSEGGVVEGRGGEQEGPQEVTGLTELQEG